MGKIKSINVLKAGSRYTVGECVWDHDPESKGAKTHTITGIKDYTIDESVGLYIPIYEVYADNKLYKRIEHAEVEITYDILGDDKQ